MDQQVPHYGPKMPSFSGKKDQNIRGFLDNFTRFCNIYGRDDEYKSLVLPLCLKGVARNYFQTLSADVKQDFEATSEALIDRFEPIKLPIYYALPRLMALHMENKSVLEYYDQLKTESQGLGITDDHFLSIFINGLSPKIREYVLSKEPETVAEALMRARQHEVLFSQTDEEIIKIRKIVEAVLATKKKIASVDKFSHFKSSCDHFRESDDRNHTQYDSAQFDNYDYDWSFHQLQDDYNHRNVGTQQSQASVKNMTRDPAGDATTSSVSLFHNDQYEKPRNVQIFKRASRPQCDFCGNIDHKVSSCFKYLSIINSRKNEP